VKATKQTALQQRVIDVDTAPFHHHIRDCPECEQGSGRDGRLCLIGTLLARPRDLRIRAKAPKLRALGAPNGS
jgi:hypothetical protein